MKVVEWLKRLFGGALESDSFDTEPDPAAAVATPAASPPRSKPKPRVKVTLAPKWPPKFGSPFVHDDGYLWTMTPLADIAVQGIPLRSGCFVRFHRNGRVASATLAREVTLDGEVLSAGTPVSFNDDGSLQAWSATLGSDRQFMISAKGSDQLESPFLVPAGSPVSVECGKLRSVVLATEATVDGMILPAATDLIFGDSGSLSHVTPPTELVLNGVPCAAHQTAVFMFGAFLEAWPARDVIIDGVPCMGHEIVRFYEHGPLARCYVSEDVDIHGVPCQEHCRIYLHDNGHVQEATLARDHTFGDIPVEAGETVGLSQNGQPNYFVASEDFVVQGVPCAGGAEVMLYDSGHPLRAQLSAPYVLGGVEVPAGCVVHWDDQERPRLVVADNGIQAWGLHLEGPHACYLNDAGDLERALPILSGNGNARQAWLREQATVRGLTCAADSPVEFFPDGVVKSLVLALDQTVGGFLCKGNTHVIWSDDGTLGRVTLVDDTVIGGVPCMGATALNHTINGTAVYNEYVDLRPGGCVGWAKAARDFEVEGIPIKGGETVCLHPDGSFYLGTLSGNWTHPDGWVAGPGLFSLFADGRPNLLTLAEPFSFDGVSYTAGAEVSFSEAGVVSGTKAIAAIDCVVLAPTGAQ